jgi:hypothetical protein
MTTKSKQLFKRWLAINKIQLLIYYKNYLEEMLSFPIAEDITTSPLEETCSFKQFAKDMLAADIIDSKAHRPTLLFDPIPILQGRIKNPNQLESYIQNI